MALTSRQGEGIDVARRPAGVRVAGVVPVGAALGIVAMFFVPWQAAVLIGWSGAALAYVLGVWVLVGRFDAATTRENAVREDPSVAASDLMVVSAGVASLAAVGLALVKAGNAHGGTKAYLIVVGVLSVALAWSAVHTVFTLRYARLYYSDPIGGIDFNESDDPTYLDFAYLSLTIGMTFQVSDTDLTSKPVRRSALHHALLSYLFGAVIVALVINVVSSLLH
ncbi:MAG TPA: DUF1345 domain-containing protein [Acidimicrobiales bacterium]|jgi:uncharacterized membrane protein|nr:DUF1345 domain-containing protein [Acidimicrobiales bacterium]